ncbi:PspC domain-containing protein [Sphingosinicella terrae]|uniref:PspC domain-containing protein n=1 Tax=Sphingosinicella terrae TaxID=2172047 RepID=UPI000E0DAE7C|nr:PspC domain-containing protein [Sphingosinicella terrae]
MQTARPSLIARDDTFFGVCQGLGEDFGFNPNLLRVALAIGTFFNPVASLAAYGICGVVVVATRLLVPDPKQAPAATTAAELAPATDEAHNDQDWIALAAAA